MYARIDPIRRWGIRALVVALVAAGLTVGSLVAGQGPAGAAAPGCSSARPTSVSGAIFSYTHGYSVAAFVTISFADRNRVGRNPDGSVQGGITYKQAVNTSLSSSGDPAKGGTRTWGPVCVASNIAYASIEVYPSVFAGVTRVTDTSYFGGAADEFDPVVVGAANRIDMRLPEDVTATSPAVYSNVTGYLNGYIKCGSGCGAHSGQVIPVSALNPIRAFPYLGGTACGVQGFAAGPNQLGPSTVASNGVYYRINALAGGQCGSSSQPYSIRVTCSSFCSPSGATITKSYTVGITTGHRSALNFTF